MRTRCPGCQTTFWVTAEQLKARAGKVRCGQCQIVFNVLDNLLDETAPSALGTPNPPPAVTPVKPTAPPRTASLGIQSAPVQTMPAETVAEVAPVPSASLAPPTNEAEDIDEFALNETHDSEANQIEDASEPLSESEAQELGKVTGLILPRETTEIPGYSKWTEGVIAAPLALPEEKPARWPFVLVALLLITVLAGQVVFRFRSEIAIAVPSLRPLLQSYSQAFKTTLPLPRQVELVSIEQSDLQTDTARGNLLVLNATLRNRAAYEQAYPSLELSLTDTADAAIARKVFSPKEFLPEALAADQPFKAKSDVSIRLWIEANNISAAGYRLYVFYP